MPIRLTILACLCLLPLCLHAEPISWEMCMEAAKSAQQEGRNDEAEQALCMAIARTEQFDVTDARILDTCFTLYQLYRKMNKPNPAEAVFPVLIARLEKAYPAKDPRIGDLLTAKAKALSPNLQENAEPLFVWALAAREKEAGATGVKLVEILTTAADYYDRKGSQHGKTEPLLRRALAIQEAAFGPNDPQLIETLKKLGALLSHAKRHTEACAVNQRMVDIAESRLEPDDPSLVWALYYQSNQFQWYTVKYPEVVMLQQRIIAWYEQTGRTDDGYYEIAMHILRDAYVALGYYAEAEALITGKMLPIYKENGWTLISCVTLLADCYKAEGRLPEAEVEYRRALDLSRKDYGKQANKDHAGYMLAETLLDVYDCLRLAGKEEDGRVFYTEAETLLRKSTYTSEKYMLISGQSARGSERPPEKHFNGNITTFEKIDGIDHWRTAGAYTAAGRYYLATGRPEMAEEYFQKALASWTQMVGAKHRALVSRLTALAACYAAGKKPKEAAQTYRQALDIAEKAYGKDASLLEQYAAVLHTLKREAEAEQASARAAGIRKAR
ncbi:MAG: tetratricopeptide repeat protein [Armatimonadota bacterium]